MLPSEERLRRASVFQRAYNKRMVVSTSIVTMYILPKEGKRSDSWKPLTGFVVAKKVSKSSVKRNRAKRRIREVYRLLRTSVFSGERQDIALRDWYALVFVAHEAALAATYQEVEEAVVSCLVRGSSKNRKDKRGGNESGSGAQLQSHSRQDISAKDKPNPASTQYSEQARKPVQSSNQGRKPFQGAAQTRGESRTGGSNANRRQDKKPIQKRMERPPETKS